MTRFGRPLTDGLILAGLLFTGYLFLIVAPLTGSVGFDAFAYWSVDPTHPYSQHLGALGAFTYSPVIARPFALFALVPWYSFLWLWLAVLAGTVIWLGRSLRGALLLFAFPPVAIELYHGNVHLLIAGAIVLGFRYPGAWAFPILTKVTPGVGLVWFLARREWRQLGIALGVTAALCAVSLTVDGRLWWEWGESLLRPTNADPLNTAIAVPLWLRLPVALAIVVWGARTDRLWTVPVAVTLAMPVLWPTSFAVLAAIPALQVLNHLDAKELGRAPRGPAVEPRVGALEVDLRLDRVDGRG